MNLDEVAVEDVSRHFGRRRALAHITFRARAGSILGLLGPNGAGKSTLLGILGTLLKPSSGTIRYGSLGAATHAAVRARIGMLGHDLFLYPELTARENLVFFSALYGEAKPGDAADRALSRAGLADRAGDPVSSFSRGMRQRVALERSLIHGPQLVLLDEPFTGLDQASAEALVGRLRDLRTERAIVILATHDLDVAEGLLDEAVFIRDGRMVELMERPASLRATYRAVMARSSQ